MQMTCTTTTQQHGGRSHAGEEGEAELVLVATEETPLINCCTL